MREKLIALLIKHEGCELEAYKDTKGLWTIGIGRCLETKGLTAKECEHLKISSTHYIDVLIQRGITHDEADYLLSNDLDDCMADRTKSLIWFIASPEMVKIVLVSLCFNLGLAGLLKFKKSLSFIKDGLYFSAATELLDSKWKHDVGDRAYDLSGMIALA